MPLPVAGDTGPDTLALADERFAWIERVVARAVRHDDDGRKWFVNMLWDHRVRPLLFEGIALQEYDPVQQKLVGPRKNIFTGTDLKLVEGPHLYKRNGWYYLLTAEGGTGYEHASTLARSRSIDGPYELHPEKYLVSAKDAPFNAVQRSGHGDIVDTPDGKTYFVHLMGRPTGQYRRCVLHIDSKRYDVRRTLYEIKHGVKLHPSQSLRAKCEHEMCMSPACQPRARFTAGSRQRKKTIALMAAIAAVVVGGTSFERGNGWLLGTLLGVLTVGVLRNGLNLLGVASSVQVASIGLLVLMALLIDSWKVKA